MQIGPLETTWSNPLNCQLRQWGPEKGRSLPDISQLISSRAGPSIQVSYFPAQCSCYIHCTLLAWKSDRCFIFSIPRSPIIPCSSTEKAQLNTHKLTFDMLTWHISNREGPLSLKRLEKFLPKAPYSYASLALLASSTWPFGSSKAKDLAKVSLWLRSHWIWVAILVKEMGVYLGPLRTDKLN